MMKRLKLLLFSDGLILVFAIIFPFFLTLVYFVLLGETSGRVQKSAYGIGKLIQFVLPVFWVGMICREQWMLRRFNDRGLGLGIGFGISVFAAMLILYWGWLGQTGGVLATGSAAQSAIQTKMNGFGLNRSLFILLGVFYSVIHSGLEEYYWRWFVFKRLQRKMFWFSAAVLSSLGFMAHHVLILGIYFGYTSFLCWFASFGVAVGGLFWAYLYKRTDSIWSVWISHGIIDAAIFTLGFYILLP